MAVLLLGSCSPGYAPGTLGQVQGFAGLLVADEPKAVLIGRDVLSSGGSAADAAVAMAFTMAVTYPSRVGLGGGGICIVHNPKTKKTEALEFLAGAPAELAADAPRPTAVPALPRGLFALHAKYGRQRWESLLGPAESLARFGNPVSRALAADLAQVAEPLLRDPGSRKVFANSEGQAVKEGEPIHQPDLAAFLARLRARGPGDLYSGVLARELSEAVKAAGGTLSPDDLRQVQGRWRETLAVKFGNILLPLTAHFPPPPAAAGGVEAQMWSILAGQGRFGSASAEERGHLLAEVSMRAFADRAAWMNADGSSQVDPAELIAKARLDGLMANYSPQRHMPAASLKTPAVDFPENPAATGMVVADRDGQAVACTFTLNNLFGTGRVIPGVGMLMAAVPGRAGRGPYPLGPMIVVAHNVQEFHFAAAASGGQAAPTALMSVAAQAVLDDRPLPEAVAAPRLHHSGHPDQLFHEPNDSPARLEGLRRRGYETVEVPTIGRVNAIHCPKGLPPKPEVCQVATDPRGHGYGLGLGTKRDEPFSGWTFGGGK